jgi:hypothetical protein
MSDNRSEVGIWDVWHARSQSLLSKIKYGIIPVGNYLGSLLPGDVALVIEDLPVNREGGIQILTSTGKIGWINGNHVIQIR